MDNFWSPRGEYPIQNWFLYSVLRDQPKAAKHEVQRIAASINAFSPHISQAEAIILPDSLRVLTEVRRLYYF